MSEGVVREPGCTCTLDGTYWPPTRRPDPSCPVHAPEDDEESAAGWAVQPSTTR